MSKDIEQIKQKIIPVLKQAGVLRSSIFGSVARGEANEKSDVDVLVELPENKSMFDLVRLEAKLEQVLNKKVDVVTYYSINPLLKDIIFSQQIQIL